MKQDTENLEQQVTMWLPKSDLKWLMSERKRLTVKGWKVEIRDSTQHKKGKGFMTNRYSLFRLVGEEV